MGSIALDPAVGLVARRPDLRHEGVFRSALQLRYQVYCVECNFLSTEDYPEGVESDRHDESAAHFYAFDEADDLVGYVRLVRADVEGRFPLQDHCDLFVDPSQLPPPSQTAEISRLMVRNDYRRRRDNRLAGVTIEQNIAAFGGERRHQSPQVLLRLYRQMYAYCREHGVRYWFAAMERPLARALSLMGFGFRQVGPMTDYYGPVVPYLADLRELEAQIGSIKPDLLAWLQMPERAGSVCVDQSHEWSRCKVGHTIDLA